MPEIFAAAIWPHLSPRARSCLSQTCKAFHRSIYELLPSATFDLSDLPPPKQDDLDDDDSDELDIIASRRAWQDEVDLRTTFLMRLPQLASVSLQGWHASTDLAEFVLSCSSALATASRMTCLNLSCGFLSLSSGTAIAAALPWLTTLSILDRFTYLNPQVYNFIQLDGHFFLPFSMLTKV